MIVSAKVVAIVTSCKRNSMLNNINLCSEAIFSRFSLLLIEICYFGSGTAQDFAYLEAFFFGCLGQFVMESSGNASYEIYGEVGHLVVAHVAREELSKTVDDHVVDDGFLAVLGDKGHERCEEAIGQWLAVDALDDVGRCELEAL